MSEHLLLAPLLESYFRRRLTKQRNRRAIDRPREQRHSLLALSDQSILRHAYVLELDICSPTAVDEGIRVGVHALCETIDQKQSSARRAVEVRADDERVSRRSIEHHCLVAVE